jgi:hypothetical protein
MLSNLLDTAFVGWYQLFFVFFNLRALIGSHCLTEGILMRYEYSQARCGQQRQPNTAETSLGVDKPGNSTQL